MKRWYDVCIETILICVIIIFNLINSQTIIAQEKIAITIAPDEVKQIDKFISATYERGHFNGSVLVAKDGKIYYEKGFGLANIEWNIPNNPDTKFKLASLTKQFTAMAIMILVEEQKIDLEAPVSLYLTDYRRDIGSKISVRQLLHHTSGLARSVILPAENRNDIMWTREKLLSKINQLDLIFEPGTKYSYSNIGYNLLAFIVESVSGQDYARFLKDRIFEPLGMNDTGFPDYQEAVSGIAQGYARLMGRFEKSPSNDASYVKGAGGLYSTVRDMLKWDQALYDHKLISPENTQLMYKRSKKSNYGFGWTVYDYYVSGDKRNMVVHEGAGAGSATSIERYLDDKITIIILCNMRHSQVYLLTVNIWSIIAGGSHDTLGYQVDDELQKVLFKDGITAAEEYYTKMKDDKNCKVPSSGAINRIAYQYLRTGRNEEAVKMFEFYIALYPNSSYAHDGYAEALLVSGHRHDAILNYRKAVELNFDNVTAIRMLQQLGIYETEKIISPLLITIINKGVESGLKLYKNTAIKENLPGERYINTVGGNLLRHSLKDEAYRLFLFNTAAFPGSANAWNSLADFYLKNKDKDNAIKYFKKTLEIDPINKKAIKQLELLTKK